MNEQFGPLQKKDKTKERLAVEITAITIVAKGRVKLSLTLRLIMQMGRGRLRAVNRLGEINQFVRFATVVTEENAGTTKRSVSSVDRWDTLRKIAR